MLTTKCLLCGLVSLCSLHLHQDLLWSHRTRNHLSVHSKNKMSTGEHETLIAFGFLFLLLGALEIIQKETTRYSPHFLSVTSHKKHTKVPGLILGF